MVLVVTLLLFCLKLLLESIQKMIPFRRGLSLLSSPLPVPNKSGFFPDGCFSDLFFKVLSDGKFMTFLNSLFQGIFSVNAPYYPYY